ncbi:NAD(P)H-hydrate dehydratase [Chloroflexota bacterium]
MNVCTIAEMRSMDSRAVKEFGISTEILMENAGEAAYFVIRKEFGISDKRFVVLCGPGNNGGDGFVVARKLHSNGGNVKIFLLAGKDRYQGAARQNLEIISRFPVEIHNIASAEELRNDLIHTDAIIDAMLGTGLDRAVKGSIKETINLVNKSGKVVFSLDIPSGISGDTGLEMGTSIKADYTTTFGLPKIGNLLYPGYGRGGKLYVTHISFPRSLCETNLIKADIPKPTLLPERNAQSSKMDYGPLLVIAGAKSYYWAPHASALSFLKAGGGYVYLACPQSLVPHIAQGGKEVVFQPQNENASGSIALENKDELLEMSQRVRMVIMGPGLSLDEETQELVRQLVQDIETPLLIDGDGITAVSKRAEVLKNRKADTVLTPHVGELARIIGKDKSAIEKDRVGILQQTARDINASIVLKGPHSLVGYPDQRVSVVVSGATAGKAGMATAGSGDVLNGTIAAMYCLGLDFPEAIRTGVFVHGLAGDLASIEKGPDGMTAHDILNSLPYAVKYYREQFSKISKEYYSTIHII